MSEVLLGMLIVGAICFIAMAIILTLCSNTHMGRPHHESRKGSSYEIANRRD